MYVCKLVESFGKLNCSIQPLKLNANPPHMCNSQFLLLHQCFHHLPSLLSSSSIIFHRRCDILPSSSDSIGRVEVVHSARSDFGACQIKDTTRFSFWMVFFFLNSTVQLCLDAQHKLRRSTLQLWRRVRPPRPSQVNRRRPARDRRRAVRPMAPRAAQLKSRFGRALRRSRLLARGSR